MEKKQTWIGALLDHRQVVPRWHSPAGALHAGERDSIRANFAPRVLPARWIPLLEEQAAKPDADRHVHVELSETKFLLGRSGNGAAPDSEALHRAGRVWQFASTRPELRPPERPDLTDGWLLKERANVATLRSALASYPRQPLLWSELARAHIVLGEDAKARRAMACAVQLASRSAYIRRSASRMYLHLHDVPRALRVVREHPNFGGDPRMLSAEIAIASCSNMPLRHVKAGMKMLDDHNLKPSYLSELAAALATVELEYGKHRSSRALFARSLKEPSENTVAQVQWAVERDSHIVVPFEAWQVPRPHEAKALAARLAGDWDGVLDATELWLQDEPYATRPAMIGSFVSFTEGQFRRSERLASQALLSNPDATVLRNNRAVVRAYLGDLAGAWDDVRRSMGREADTHPYLLATMGLIAYRSGDPELGAQGYRAAMAHFVKQKNVPSVVLASLFWLRELHRAQDPSAPAILQYLKNNRLRFTKGLPEPEIESMMRTLETEISQGSFDLPPTEGVPDEALRKVFHSFEAMHNVPELPVGFLEHI